MAISPGQQVHHYIVQDKIGEGGMGMVYRAEQPTLHRTVVLKVLSTKVADEPGMLERFRRELDIVARLEHPYILPVYDVGDWEGSPYIVMRYMSGGSLRDRLRAGGLPRDLLLRMLEQVADALDTAHGYGVIHRDLKPANILLDDGGNAYLADFGLAKSMEGGQDLTTTGSVLGTPAYMSPEQARGEKLDARSDVYSFAVLAFEALSGRPPFTADTSWGIIQKHLVEPPPSILDFAPHLPKSVNGVLQAGLAKERDRRPARAGDFVRSLRASLAGEDPSARPVVEASHSTVVGAPARRTSPDSGAPRRAPSRPVSRPRESAAWAIPVVVLVLGGGLALAAAVAAIALLALRGQGGAPKVSTYAVGDSPRALLFDGESLWVANGFDNTIVRLAAAGCDASPDPCGGALGAYAVDDLPVGLAYEGGSLWVASALRGNLTQLDPKTGQELGRTRLPSLPSTLLAAGGYLWTANSYGQSVTKVSPDGSVVGEYPMSGSPLGLAFDGTSLWVSLQSTSELIRLDPETGGVMDSFGLDGRPSALAFDGQRVWVTLEDRNEVEAIDPATGEVIRRVPVGDRPVALLFDGASLWTAEDTGASVSRIDVATGERQMAVSLQGGPYALAWVSCGPGCGDLWTANEATDTVSRLRVK